MRDEDLVPGAPCEDPDGDATVRRFADLHPFAIEVGSPALEGLLHERRREVARRGAHERWERVDAAAEGGEEPALAGNDLEDELRPPRDLGDGRRVVSSSNQERSPPGVSIALHRVRDGAARSSTRHALVRGPAIPSECTARFTRYHPSARTPRPRSSTRASGRRRGSPWTSTSAVRVTA